MKKILSSLFVFVSLFASAQSPAKVATQKLGYLVGVSFTLILPMVAVGLLIYGLHRAIKRRRAFNLQK